MWFQTKPTPEPEIVLPRPSHPVDYPAGICVHSESGYYLINRDGKRYRIISDRVLSSWRFPYVVETSEIALKNHPVAVTKLGFRDGSLLTNIANGRMYLVSGGKMRHVTSPDALARIGLTPQDSILISDTEINLMKVGEDIY